MAIKTVETIRRIRDEYHNLTKDLSREQQRDFFRKKAEEAARLAKNLRKPARS
jgi:hypothetical protein